MIISDVEIMAKWVKIRTVQHDIYFLLHADNVILRYQK